jgi:hypothetical protein
MAGSAADTPTTPEFIRVSDVDRDHAVDELRKEFVDGRLSHDTFLLRMQAAMDARNQGQLSGLFYDLPTRPSRLTRVREAVRRLSRNSLDAMSDVLPARRHEGQHYPDLRYDEPPSPLPAATEQAVPSNRLMFPPGTDTSFTIGRDQRCDLYIADMTVSRLHARLDRGADGWMLSDLGSSNGTRVNGWRLRSPVLVRAGDTITFGSAVFVLQSGQGPQPGQGPRPEERPRPEEGEPGHPEG